MIATAIYVATAAGLGGIAGLLGGLFGVGGGFLVIPLLGFFYGMDQQTTQGTVLIMVVPNVVWAFFALSATLWDRSTDGCGHRRVGFDSNLSDSPFGDRTRPTCPTACFRSLLATIAVTVAYHTWRGVVRVGVGPTSAWGWITVVGLIGGCFSGFFGVGGAFVAPPLLMTFFGLRQLEAQGLEHWPSFLRAGVSHCWLMPKPVGLIGLSDYRLH
jgi:uncharacterized membrane protein YfcA